MNEVYFVKPVNAAGPIKIGFTALIRDRINSLNLWSPVPLEVVATIPGGRELERRFHMRFLASRERGEWFRWTQDLADTIRDIQLGTFDIDTLPIGSSLPQPRTPIDRSVAVHDPRLLADVLEFCERHEIALATFGRAAANDPALVQGLRQGRSPRLRVNTRIRTFMATYRTPAPNVEAAAL